MKKSISLQLVFVLTVLQTTFSYGHPPKRDISINKPASSRAIARPVALSADLSAPLTTSGVSGRAGLQSDIAFAQRLNRREKKASHTVVVHQGAVPIAEANPANSIKTLKEWVSQKYLATQNFVSQHSHVTKAAIFALAAATYYGYVTSSGSTPMLALTVPPSSVIIPAITAVSAACKLPFDNLTAYPIPEVRSTSDPSRAFTTALVLKFPRIPGYYPHVTISRIGERTPIEITKLKDLLAALVKCPDGINFRVVAHNQFGHIPVAVVEFNDINVANYLKAFHHHFGTKENNGQFYDPPTFHVSFPDVKTRDSFASVGTELNAERIKIKLVGPHSPIVEIPLPRSKRGHL